jgi:hypothetical protein
MHRRPLASFSILSQIYAPQHPPKPQHPPNPQHHKPKSPVAIAKPEVIAPLAAVAPVAALEKKKIKITVAKKTSASTSAAAPPVSPVPAPPPAPASPAPMSPRTKKIKITIKQQPKQEKLKQEKPKQECYHLHDFAPPASIIYTPCGDYIVPPPKCCRFFIENRHCFLRSADNACIDPITKEVFGFWNCEIGKKCELLPPPPTDDHDQYDDDDHATSANLVQLDNNDGDDCNKIDAVAMRKKSDANRARITGQPVALLRQKIATKHGMHSFNSLGNRR